MDGGDKDEDGDTDSAVAVKANDYSTPQEYASDASSDRDFASEGCVRHKALFCFQNFFVFPIKCMYAAVRYVTFSNLHNVHRYVSSPQASPRGNDRDLWSGVDDDFMGVGEIFDSEDYQAVPNKMPIEQEGRVHAEDAEDANRDDEKIRRVRSMRFT